MNHATNLFLAGDKVAGKSVMDLISVASSDGFSNGKSVANGDENIFRRFLLLWRKRNLPALSSFHR